MARVVRCQNTGSGLEAQVTISSKDRRALVDVIHQGNDDLAYKAIDKLRAEGCEVEITEEETTIRWTDGDAKGTDHVRGLKAPKAE